MNQEDLLRQVYEEFNIFPAKNDKSPAVKQWTIYRENKISFDKLKGCEYFGLITGVSGLEVIDIDNHFGDAAELYQIVVDNVSEDIFNKLMIVATAGGGYHLYYRCQYLEGNQKLASRINDKGRPETLIETRGKGGYVICPPSPKYNLKTDLSINEITIDQRSEIIEVCRSLNEIVEDKSDQKKPTDSNTDAPGERYNNDTFSVNETISLLKNAGWTSRDNKHWCRPGKKSGISATFNKVGKNKFYCFSTNAYPFEPSDMVGSYSMFGVLTMLSYNGNFSECAKDLAKKYNMEKPKLKPTDAKEKKTRSSSKKWQALQDIIDDWKMQFRYNELTKIIEWSQGNGWNQLGLLVNDIVKEMETERGIESISPGKVIDMISTTEISNPYNPVHDFIEYIPEWDGEDHISKLCTHIRLQGDENASFFNIMLKKHLIRTIRCGLDDFYVNRMVFVLFGPQEIGKSKFWEWLAPRDLYYDEPVDNPSDKDTKLALARYLIFNLDELDQLQKKEVARLKAFVSKSNINERVSYGRTDEKFIRVASFVASTNKSDLLADESNTRWLIMKIANFDWKKYTKEVDRIQVWAQAKAIYMEDVNSGELTGEEKSERERRNNSDFLETSQEREMLMKYYTDGDEYYTATEVKIEIERKHNSLKINITQLVRELHRLHGQPQIRSVEGKKGRYYGLTSLLKFQKEEQFSSYSEPKEWPF